MIDFVVEDARRMFRGDGARHGGAQSENDCSGRVHRGRRRLPSQMATCGRPTTLNRGFFVGLFKRTASPLLGTCGVGDYSNGDLEDAAWRH